MARKKVRRLGVHTSIAGGLHLSLTRAYELGCTTVQIFSHSPRGWRLTPIPDEQRALFRRLARRLDIRPIYVHASYLINIASASEAVRGKSAALLRAEMQRADALGAHYVVLHTGSAHDGPGRRRAAEIIREALGGGGFKAGLLIENTAGERGDVASGAGELAEIMEAADGLVAGVCIDTCHAFAAGYDIGAEEGIRALLRPIGSRAVKLIHLNDSKGGLGSRIDRHEHIGMGRIGAEALGFFVSHGKIKDIPLILETPKKKDTDDPENLKRARALLEK